MYNGHSVAVLHLCSTTQACGVCWDTHSGNVAVWLCWGTSPCSVAPLIETKKIQKKKSHENTNWNWRWKRKRKKEEEEASSPKITSLIFLSRSAHHYLHRHLQLEHRAKPMRECFPPTLQISLEVKARKKKGNRIKRHSCKGIRSRALSHPAVKEMDIVANALTMKQSNFVFAIAVRLHLHVPCVLLCSEALTNAPKTEGKHCISYQDQRQTKT